METDNRSLLVAQLVGSLFILWADFSNAIKLVALLLLWITTFWPIQRFELVLFIFAGMFFSVMNVLSLKQGIFRFSKPDLLGLPAYEFVMWGFYLLHVQRMLAGQISPKPSAKVWTLALLYAASFAILANPQILLCVTASLLLASLFLHHEPFDLAYAGYMVLIGAFVEYLGTATGLWTYPSPPIGGVPFWFVTLWGGVGFFLRRLIMPFTNRQDCASRGSALLSRDQ